MGRDVRLFFPYIRDAVGTTTDRANLALQAIWLVSTALAVACVLRVSATSRVCNGAGHGDSIDARRET